MEDLTPIYGGPFPIPLPEIRPIAQIIVQWEWAHPLAAILKFGGWSIHDAVNDPRVAGAVLQLWKVWKLAGRDRSERERRNRLREQMAWRREGLPVPCPVCASLEPCSCRLDFPGP